MSRLVFRPVLVVLAPCGAVACSAAGAARPRGDEDPLDKARAGGARGARTGPRHWAKPSAARRGRPWCSIRLDSGSAWGPITPTWSSKTWVGC